MSSGAHTPAVAQHLRHARFAVSTLFFLNAVLYANLVPRLPEIKDALDLSNAALGTAIAAMPVGAMLSGLLAPALIQRLGSARVASFGLVLLAGAVAMIPLTRSWAQLAAVMALAGALDSVVDVAQNAHGFRVQRAYRRSIVHAFHGVWSIGAVTGGILGSAAAGLALPLPGHLAVTGVVFAVVAVVAYRFLLTGPEDAERVAVDGGGAGPRGLRHVSRRTLVVLAALGVMAACGAFVEDAGSSWGALYMRGEVGADPATAGLAFVSLSVAMTIGRLTGDRVVDRFGQVPVSLTGGAMIAVGMGVALAVPSVAMTIGGFALAGLGVATLVPAVMHAADELPGLPHGVGLTVVSWVLRVGFLASPALVGVVADAASLRVGLLGVVLAGVGVLVFGRFLGGSPSLAAGVRTPGPGESEGSASAADDGGRVVGSAVGPVVPPESISPSSAPAAPLRGPRPTERVDDQDEPRG